MDIRSSVTLLFALLPGAPLAANYTTEFGFDRPGPEYETFEQTSEYQLHELCRDRCESQPQCKSYTFVKPGIEGKHGFCHMRDHEPAPVENACCVSAVKGGKPARRAIPSLKLSWLGNDADKVGKPPRAAEPDGAMDHHLRLEIRLAPNQAIESIELREEARTNASVLRWSTVDPKAEPLAAELSGRRLTAGEQPLANPDGGPTVVDLYAHDIGQWDANRTVVAEVRLASGQKITHTFTLEAPPDRLLGIWQMLCASGGFEPRTMSGRILLVLQPDGTLGGAFDSMPITGKLDATGKVEGSAKDARTQVEFSGQLEPIKRGKPLVGSGSFQFIRAADNCAGPSHWSSK